MRMLENEESPLRSVMPICRSLAVAGLPPPPAVMSTPFAERGVGDHRLAEIVELRRRDVGDRYVVRAARRVLRHARVLRKPGAFELGCADLELAAGDRERDRNGALLDASGEERGGEDDDRNGGGVMRPARERRSGSSLIRSSGCRGT